MPQAQTESRSYIKDREVQTRVEKPRGQLKLQRVGVYSGTERSNERMMLERLGERPLPEEVMVTCGPWRPWSRRADSSHSRTELTQLDPRSNCLNLRTELKRITIGYWLQLAGDGRSGNRGAVMGMEKGGQLVCWGGADREMAKGDLESLSLEMFNNRGGSCHCCFGCGSA